MPGVALYLSARAARGGVSHGAAERKIERRRRGSNAGRVSRPGGRGMRRAEESDGKLRAPRESAALDRGAGVLDVDRNAGAERPPRPGRGPGLRLGAALYGRICGGRLDASEAYRRPFTPGAGRIRPPP